LAVARKLSGLFLTKFTCSKPVLSIPPTAFQLQKVFNFLPINFNNIHWKNNPFVIYFCESKKIYSHPLRELLLCCKTEKEKERAREILCTFPLH
jgi:hypothetical protein